MIYIDSLAELHMYTLEGDDYDNYREIKPGQYLKESEIRDVVIFWLKVGNVWEAVLQKNKEIKTDVATDEETVDTLLYKMMNPIWKLISCGHKAIMWMRQTEMYTE